MIEKYICIGNLNFDLIFCVDRMPAEHEKLRASNAIQEPGGSASNTAYWLARLGSRVKMIGTIGDDIFGKLCVDALKNVGVCTEDIQVTSKDSTGLVSIFTSSNSKRMVSSGGANKYLDFSEILFEDSKDHVHICHSNAQMASLTLKTAKERGLSTSCDFNGSGSLDLIRYCDYSLMNNDEFIKCFGNDDPRILWKSISESNRQLLILTQGSKGVMVCGGEINDFIPTIPVKVIDRTGGGDSFNAGFLTGIGRNFSIVESVNLGLLLAAHNIQYLGSRPTSPINNEINKLINIT
jgi:sugar/nucleoside kinase (ribokinase family)